MKFRHTNFMRLIYATLLALPFVAILSRVIYVQSNKNAYQSTEITQTTFNKVNKYQTNNITQEEDLIRGNIYEFVFDEIAQGYCSINYDEVWIINNDNYASIHTTLMDYFEFNEGSFEIEYSLDNNDFSYFDESLFSSFKLYFVFHSIGDGSNFSTELIQSFRASDFIPFDTVEVESTTLDNVFEYSVNKFIENNNFGKINLFQWTTNLFFDSNDVNNMYVGFINWYLNYTLLVSATYILFLVLMWFINYARRLLERGMNYDW